VKYPDSSNTGTTLANIDSDSSDVVSSAYNAQGQESYRKTRACSRSPHHSLPFPRRGELVPRDRSLIVASSMTRPA
jgi:hypothetical protein